MVMRLGAEDQAAVRAAVEARKKAEAQARAKEQAAADQAERTLRSKIARARFSDEASQGAGVKVRQARGPRLGSSGAPDSGARTVRSPQVVQKELNAADAALKKKGLNPGLRRELQDSQQQLKRELRGVLTQTISDEKEALHRMPPDERGNARARIASYEVQLGALGGPLAPSAEKGPAVPHPATPAELKAAKDKVDAAYTSGGAEQAMVTLEKQTMALTQADAATLVHSCGPVIDQAAKDMLKGDGQKSRQAIVSLSHATHLAGPQATKEVAGKLATVITETPTGRAGKLPSLGNYGKGFEDAIGAGAGVDLALATRDALKAAGKPVAAAAIGKCTIDALNAPVKAYDQAREANAKAEAQLAQDMARFGNGLSDTERKKYADAFWANAENKAVQDEWNSAQQHLDTEMRVNGQALEAATRAGDKDAGKVLLKGYETLASSPTGAGQSLEFVNRINHDQALFDALNNDGKLEKHLADDLLSPAIGSAQARAIASGSNDELVAQLQNLAWTGGSLKDIPGEMQGLVDSQKQIAELLASKASRTEIMRTLHLGSLTEDWSGKSKLSKTVAIATVVFALNQATSSDDGLDRISGALQAVQGGLDVATGVLGTLGKAGKMGGSAAKVLSGALPYVGLAVDGAQLAEDIRTLTNGGNAGDVVALVGTGINLVGDIAGIVPVLGTAVDEVLGLVGTVVQGVGSFISSLITNNDDEARREAARASYLEAAGVRQDTRDVLMKGGFVDGTELSTMKLSREQFLAALKAQQALPTNDKGKSVYAVEMSWKLAAAYGLKGDAAVKFVAQMRQKVEAMNWRDLGDLNNSLTTMSSLAMGASFDGRSPGEIRDALRDNLSTVSVVFERVAGDVFSQWGLDSKSTGDFNLEFFTAFDKR